MKKLLILLSVLVSICLRAASPSFDDFNNNQFRRDSNTISIRALAGLTNPVVRGANVFTNTLLMVGSTSVVGSVTNGTGVLTNNGSGVFGWNTNFATGTVGPGTPNTLPKFTGTNSIGDSRSSDDGAILSLASNGSDLTGITNSTDVIGIGDFALSGLVGDGLLNIYGIGDSALSSTTLGGFSGQVFAFGDSAFSGMTISNVTGLYGIGTSVGNFMNGDGISDVLAMGNGALGSVFFTNSVAGVFAIGDSALRSATLDGSGLVFAFGDNALSGVLLTNASTIFGFGSGAGQNMAGGMSEVFAVGVSAADTLSGDGSEIYAYGHRAMHDAILTNSPSSIYAFGNEAANTTKFDGVANSVYAFGASALSSATLTNGSDIYAFGNGTGAGLAGTFSHIFLLGSGAQATANNQWVAGDAAYTYIFPGAYLTLNSQTNQISDNGTALTYNGVPITAGSGSGVSTTVTPLAYSGTNITGFNCLTNNATYTLVLTNHCLFNAATFTGLPNTTTNMFFTLGFQQNSAGGWVPKLTNSIVTYADGVQPVIKTNANAVSYLYFHTHLFTNGMLVASPNINVQ